MRILTINTIIRMARLAKKIAAVAILLIVSASLSAKEKIAVVYPVVREPFSSIYRDFLA